MFKTKFSTSGVTMEQVEGGRIEGGVTIKGKIDILGFLKLKCDISITLTSFKINIAMGPIDIAGALKILKKEGDLANGPEFLVDIKPGSIVSQKQSATYQLCVLSTKEFS